VFYRAMPGYADPRQCHRNASRQYSTLALATDANHTRLAACPSIPLTSSSLRPMRSNSAPAYGAKSNGPARATDRPRLRPRVWAVGAGTQARPGRPFLAPGRGSGARDRGRRRITPGLPRATRQA
jgi:hypothetical protein